MLYIITFMSNVLFTLHGRGFILQCTYFLIGPVQGNLKATVDNMLDDGVFSTLQQQFLDDSVLFQHDDAPVHKDSSIKKCSPQFGLH